MIIQIYHHNFLPQLSFKTFDLLSAFANSFSVARIIPYRWVIQVWKKRTLHVHVPWGYVMSELRKSTSFQTVLDEMPRFNERLKMKLSQTIRGGVSCSRCGAWLLLRASRTKTTEEEYPYTKSVPLQQEPWHISFANCTDFFWRI